MLVLLLAMFSSKILELCLKQTKKKKYSPHIKTYRLKLLANGNILKYDRSTSHTINTASEYYSASPRQKYGLIFIGPPAIIQFVRAR